MFSTRCNPRRNDINSLQTLFCKTSKNKMPVQPSRRWRRLANTYILYKRPAEDLRLPSWPFVRTSSCPSLRGKPLYIFSLSLSLGNPCVFCSRHLEPVPSCIPDCTPQPTAAARAAVISCWLYAKRYGGAR